MNNEEKIRKALEKETDFISTPMQFVYETLDFDLDDVDLVEGLKIVQEYNKKILNEKARNNEKLRSIISQDKLPTVVAEESIKINPSPIVASYIVKPELEDIFNKINYIKELNDFEEFIINNPYVHQYIPEIKLFLYGKINSLKQQMLDCLHQSYMSNIESFQNDINCYELFLNFLVEFNKEESLDDLYENSLLTSHNIVLIPNRKNSTYIFEDIIGYIENAKEIKLTFDKIMSGYFLKSKSTKAIVGRSEKLFEYIHPNGIRILYIVNGNKIFISSLFFKDKQKSTKITSYYDEAITRYHNALEYLKQYPDEIEFNIEQLELIGEIYGILEDKITLSKKGGE